MKIQIEQAEIERAVREYVASQGIKIEGKDLSIEFRMTRVDGGGLIANLAIEEPKPVEPVKGTTTRAPRAGTVGAAIASQTAKADKPAKEKETSNEAPAAAEETKADGTNAAAEQQAETTTEAGAEDAGTPEEQASAAAENPAPAKAASLFG